MDAWYAEEKEITYIRIDDSFKHCADFGQQTSQK